MGNDIEINLNNDNNIVAHYGTEKNKINISKDFMRMFKKILILLFQRKLLLTNVSEIHV